MYRHSLKSGNASGIGEAIRFVASGGRPELLRRRLLAAETFSEPQVGALGQSRTGKNPLLKRARLPFSPRAHWWCGQQDSNLHGLKPPDFESGAFYQFRHAREEEKEGGTDGEARTPRDLSIARPQRAASTSFATSAFAPQRACSSPVIVGGQGEI